MPRAKPRTSITGRHSSTRPGNGALALRQPRRNGLIDEWHGRARHRCECTEGNVHHRGHRTVSVGLPARPMPVPRPDGRCAVLVAQQNEALLW
jgi:hypothetical protein